MVAEWFLALERERSDRLKGDVCEAGLEASLETGLVDEPLGISAVGAGAGADVPPPNG